MPFRLASSDCRLATGHRKSRPIQSIESFLWRDENGNDRRPGQRCRAQSVVNGPVIRASFESKNQPSLLLITRHVRTMRPDGASLTKKSDVAQNKTIITIEKSSSLNQPALNNIESDLPLMTGAANEENLVKTPTISRGKGKENDDKKGKGTRVPHNPNVSHMCVCLSLGTRREY